MQKRLRLSGTLLSTILVIMLVAVIVTVTFLCNKFSDNDALHNSDESIYEVWSGEKLLFSTNDLNDYFKASGDVEKLMSERLGYTHSLVDDLSIKIIAAKKSTVLSGAEEMYTILLSEIETLYSDCYAIYLDGSVICYCPLSEKENLETIVADIIAYISKKDSNHNKTSEVSAALGYAKTDSIISDVSDINKVLSSSNSGDTSLEEEFDDTVTDIIIGIDNALQFGSGNTVPENVLPSVTVTTERVVRTEIEVVKFEKLRAPDTEYGLRYGDDDPDFVYITGKDGVCTVEYEDVYINGEYSHTVRIDNSINITVEPVHEITVYGTQSTTASFNFIWPTVGYITSEFGPRNLAGSNYHRGIDISRSGNPDIIAADAGVVIMSGWHSSYGWYVKIDHGNGICTLYAHMCRRPEVEVGEKVFKGEHLGNMGRTGNVTGAHLHFEVYVNGSRVNPRKYLTGNPAKQ